MAPRGNYPSENADQYIVRLPAGMRARIKGHAKANGQSMNAAIIVALEAHYPAPVEPESPNEALLEAAEEVMGGWEAILRAMGQDPDENEALARLRATVEAATK